MKIIIRFLFMKFEFKEHFGNILDFKQPYPF